LKPAVREIPLAKPWMGEREEELVLEVLRSGRLSLGPTIDEFERLVAERVRAPYAAAVSSGTAGLHLLCRIAAIEPGDEVITSTLSFAASANCFIYEGGVPVLVDVDPRTLNMDPAAVESAITERTKAIVAVDIFGYPCELDALRELAARHELALIQDSAEALGAEYKGVPVGGHGVPAIFGFYPNKQLATGEGGVVTAHDEETFQLVVSMRNQGRQYAGGSWFDHVRLGFNYRWTDIQAAVGIAQLEKLDRMLERRAAAAARYGELLAGLDGVETLIADDEEHKRSWFVYVVKLAPELDRDEVMGTLRREGVGTAEYIPCIHLQEYMRRDYGFRAGQFPVAEDTSRRTLALPFFPQIETEDQERVAEVLRGAVERG